MRNKFAKQKGLWRRKRKRCIGQRMYYDKLSYFNVYIITALLYLHPPPASWSPASGVSQVSGTDQGTFLQDHHVTDWIQPRSRMPQCSMGQHDWRMLWPTPTYHSTRWSQGLLVANLYLKAKQYIKHERSCSTTFLNAENRVENTMKSGVFLTNLEVFGKRSQTLP